MSTTVEQPRDEVHAAKSDSESSEDQEVKPIRCTYTPPVRIVDCGLHVRLSRCDSSTAARLQWCTLCCAQSCDIFTITQQKPH